MFSSERYENRDDESSMQLQLYWKIVTVKLCITSVTLKSMQKREIQMVHIMKKGKSSWKLKNSEYDCDILNYQIKSFYDFF